MYVVYCMEIDINGCYRNDDVEPSCLQIYWCSIHKDLHWQPTARIASSRHRNVSHVIRLVNLKREKGSCLPRREEKVHASREERKRFMPLEKGGKGSCLSRIERSLHCIEAFQLNIIYAHTNIRMSFNI